MDRDDLRALQEPLKNKYREQPESALFTLRASGNLGEGVSCKIETGRVLAAAGLHPAAGGQPTSLCSGELLLEALVACAGVTLGAVATSLQIPIEHGEVHVEGDIDFRGTLGIDSDAPVGFTAIRMRFDVRTSASDEEIETLLRLSERYCVVYQTLAQPGNLSASWARPD